MQQAPPTFDPNSVLRGYDVPFIEHPAQLRSGLGIVTRYKDQSGIMKSLAVLHRTCLYYSLYHLGFIHSIVIKHVFGLF
jgi:hypothetical protein